MNLPDIPTSIGFWAGIATIGGAAGAWFTFVASAYKSRRDAYEAIRSLLVGVKIELDFIKQWASGGDGDPGYVLSTDPAEIVKAKPEWFNPSRYIFTFETPTLQNFTLSPYLRQLGPIVAPLVKLNFAFRKLLDLHADYRSLATGDPVLYSSVFRKNKTKGVGDPVTAIELDFMNALFDVNLRMHRDLIGGETSKDELCLYRAYRSAKQVVDKFEVELRPEPLPKWYWVLHTFAFGLVAVSVWELLRWFAIR